MKKPELVSLLTEACQHPYGVKVRTNDPNKLRQRLYAIRRESQAFEFLSFVIPSTDPENMLFIIRKEPAPDAS